MKQAGLAEDSLTESIEAGSCLLAQIVYADKRPEQTVFVTPGTLSQQVGFIVYPADSSIPRHLHNTVQRTIVGTPEVLIVRRGRVQADFYTDRKEYVTSRILNRHDVLILISGGHGFTCFEDTILLEVKQGPYIGPQEKERF